MIHNEIREISTKMIPIEIREIATKIGLFYLEKNNNDYTITEKQVKDLGISDIALNDGKIAITTTRPGMLIGKRGNNIAALEKYLGKPIKIFEKPDDLLYYLIPADYSGYKDFDRFDHFDHFDLEDNSSYYDPYL